MKILIIQQKMIGDVLTSSILFEALRLKYPKAQLDYLINEHTFPVVENNPNIDNFVLFTKQDELSKSNLLKFARSVGNKKYDIVVDTYSKLSSNLISLFSGAKTKISYHKYYTTLFYHYNIKREKHNDGKAGLAIVNRMQLLAPLGIETSFIKPKIYLTEKEIFNSKEFLESYQIDFSKPLYMISVLGSGKNKTYPFNYMAEVIDTLVKETSGQILFNYIPKQETEARAILDLCKPETQKNIHFNIFGKSLRAFLAITSHCDALIGNEGGAINMAKALNIKTFAIYSPWIDKATWNLFENDNNVSVHLKDFKPELYTKAEKKYKKETAELYKKFEPQLFRDKLKAFLKL
ncbi:glycosyltransferase family 9 protein [Flavivirga rizhaonensis]|uniref:Lipopolysaccharide heptosyltransferase family protein n=1 Tax=Flavivirga rizhaonensis TaxID=2559571 RepID=A0A4S1DZF3_9FLAO|nr:glycosyltransferase family 9 protein [Flavivirga rizhaonensis]TGV02988.1 lipopolysaccharide heptosyltransferase family protein [Flavivirga rizhaonensis]